MTSALKKERQSLENASSKLLQLALGAGATAAEVCASYGSKTRIGLEKQDFHMASTDDGYLLGVRVLKGQRQGFASCNTTDPRELKEIASRAVEIASFSPENPYYVIAPSENIPKEAPAQLWDDALHNLSVQTQKDWTRVMLEEAMKDSRFRLNEGSMTIHSGLFLVMNSQGTLKLERGTEVTWSLMGMAVEGDVITSFDYFTQMSRVASKAPEKILATTRQFRERVVADLKQGPARSYRGLVVFSPRAVIDILLSPLSYHLNARSVVEKTGRWSLSDLDKNVVDSQLTLRDMPWLTDRMGCSIFDREGTPTRNLPLLENGVLRNFFTDGYAGKALGRPSTGHAAGGPSSAPTVGPHCLCVGAGTEPLRDLLQRARKQSNEFLVLQRYSGQVDPVTGDFSGVAKGGEWWHGGERAYCVKETLISGNLFDVLGKSIFGISRETEIVESSEESPTIVVDNVSVTSG